MDKKVNKVNLFDLTSEIGDIWLLIERADTLLEILTDNYFDIDGKTLEKDELKQYDFIKSYDQIDALVRSVRDITFDTKKRLDALSDINPKDITKE